MVRDEWPSLACGQCKHFNVRASFEGTESTCKRLDHKHIQFAVPWFKSYDCGQYQGCVCSDFEPAAYCKWLCANWKGFDDYYAGDTHYNKGLLGLCIDGDQSVRYLVKKEDFMLGNFINDDGSLKWVVKQYYKQSRNSPIGYVLVTEKNPVAV